MSAQSPNLPLVQSDEQQLILDLGLKALHRINADKTWDDWLSVGAAVKVVTEMAVLQAKSGPWHRDNKSAVRMFNGLWEHYEHSDGSNHRPLSSSERTQLRFVMDHPEIEVWRGTLDSTKRRSLNHPNAVVSSWRKATQTPDKEATRAKQAKMDVVIELEKELADGGYYVEDDGPGIAGSPEQIARLFSISRPMISTKLLRLPTRGALGNGLRVVAGAVLASEGKLIVITKNRRIRLRPARDGGTGVASAKAVKFPTGTRVEISFGPGIPADDNALRWSDVAILLRDGPTYAGKSSPYWYDVPQFHELLSASGKKPVRETVKTTARGMPGVSGVTVVTNSYAFYLCIRGCGRIGRPAFPAPSMGERFCAQLGQIMPRECRLVSRRHLRAIAKQSSLVPKDSGLLRRSCSSQ